MQEQEPEQEMDHKLEQGQEQEHQQLLEQEQEVVEKEEEEQHQWPLSPSPAPAARSSLHHSQRILAKDELNSILSNDMPDNEDEQAAPAKRRHLSWSPPAWLSCLSSLQLK